MLELKHPVYHFLEIIRPVNFTRMLSRRALIPWVMGSQWKRICPPLWLVYGSGHVLIIDIIIDLGKDIHRCSGSAWETRAVNWFRFIPLRFFFFYRYLFINLLLKDEKNVVPESWFSLEKGVNYIFDTYYLKKKSYYFSRKISSTCFKSKKCFLVEF